MTRSTKLSVLAAVAAAGLALPAQAHAQTAAPAAKASSGRANVTFSCTNHQPRPESHTTTPARASVTAAAPAATAFAARSLAEAAAMAAPSHPAAHSRARLRSSAIRPIVFIGP